MSSSAFQERVQCLGTVFEKALLESWAQLELEDWLSLLSLAANSDKGVTLLVVGGLTGGFKDPHGLRPSGYPWGIIRVTGYPRDRIAVTGPTI